MNPQDAGFNQGLKLAWALMKPLAEIKPLIKTNRRTSTTKAGLMIASYDVRKEGVGV